MGMNIPVRRETRFQKDQSRRRARRAAVQGDQEIIDIINQIGPNVGKKAMRKSLRRGAKEVVMPTAKAMAPRDTGQLEKSLTVRAQKRSRSKFGYDVVVRPTSPAAKYAFALEFGTKYVAADPFLRPAGYSNRQKVFDFAIWDVKKVLKEMGHTFKSAKRAQTYSIVPPRL